MQAQRLGIAASLILLLTITESQEHSGEAYRFHNLPWFCPNRIILRVPEIHLEWSAARSHPEHRLTYYQGNTTYAALTAIIAANLILAAYIILSFLEDKNSLRSPKNSQSARVSTDSRKDK